MSNQVMTVNEVCEEIEERLSREALRRADRLREGLDEKSLEELSRQADSLYEMMIFTGLIHRR